ncbi:hypothetical protein FOZ62_030108, partial [Perkinsus olseni]
MPKYLRSGGLKWSRGSHRSIGQYWCRWDGQKRLLGATAPFLAYPAPLAVRRFWGTDSVR